LTAQADHFIENLDKAMTKLRSFEGGVGGTLKSVGGLFGAGLGVGIVGTGIGKIEGALSGMAHTALDAAKSLWEFIKPALHDIEHLTHLSHSLGLSTKALTGFAYAAKLSGVGAEHMEMGLRILSRKLGQLQAEVSGTGTGIGEAFLDESGEIQVATKGVSAKFEQIGLSAKKLAGASMKEAFLDIAEAIKNLPTAAERGAAAFAIFGRQGQQLLPVLEKGKAGLEDLAAAAEKMGYAFDERGAAKVEELQKSLHNLDAQTEGFRRQLAIQLAPDIDTAVSAFQGLIDAMGGAKKAAHGVRSSLYGASPLGMLDPLRLMPKFFPQKPEKFHGKHGIEEDDEGIGAGNLGESLKAAKLAESIEKVEKSLEKEAATFGMSKAAVSVWELEQLGAGKATLQHAHALGEQIDALEKVKKATEKLAETSKKVHQETRGDLGKLADEYKDLFDVGHHALITRDEYLQGLGKLGTDAARKLAGVEAHGPRGLEVGSKEAFGAVRDYNEFGQRSQADPVKVLQKLQEEANRVAVEHLRNGLRIEEALNRGALNLPVVTVP
jgi:hypothetical protein